MKKLLYCLLALLISSVIITGCGKSQEGSAKGASSKQTAAKTTPDASEKAPEAQKAPEEEPAGYSAYAGTWFGRSEKLTITADSKDSLLFDFSSYNCEISEYINTSDIINGKYNLHYTDFFGEEMKLEISFLTDAIVLHHVPLSYGDSYEYTEAFEKYVHSEATLDVKNYFDEDSYFVNYEAEGASLHMSYEAEILFMHLALDNVPAYISFSKKMAVPHDKGILLIPDQENSNSYSFNITQSSADSYNNDPTGIDGTLTLTFEEDGTICYKLTGCAKTGGETVEGTLTKYVNPYSAPEETYSDDAEYYSPKADSYYEDYTYEEDYSSPKADSYYEEYYDDGPVYSAKPDIYMD